MTHPDLLIRTTRGISDTQDQSKKKSWSKNDFPSMSKKFFFRSPKFFPEIFFFVEMTSWRFHTIPDRSQPLHIAKSDYQDSEILGFWSKIDDMVLALLRATIISGGCARQFWHGQGCPEVIRYRELEKSWRLSERKPLEWCDFRVVETIFE